MRLVGRRDGNFSSCEGEASFSHNSPRRKQVVFALCWLCVFIKLNNPTTFIAFPHKIVGDLKQLLETTTLLLFLFTLLPLFHRKDCLFLARMSRMEAPDDPFLGYSKEISDPIELTKACKAWKKNSIQQHPRFSRSKSSVSIFLHIFLFHFRYKDLILLKQIIITRGNDVHAVYPENRN